MTAADCIFVDDKDHLGSAVVLARVADGAVVCAPRWTT